MFSDPENQKIQEPHEYEGITYQEILYVLKKHRSMIILITLAVLIVTLFYTLIQSPIYKSTGLIMIDDGPQSMDMFQMSSLSGRNNYLSNEIEILSSRTTAERTIKKLLNSDYKNNLFLFGTKKHEISWIRNFPGYNFLFLDKSPIELDKKIDNILLSSFAKRLTDRLSVTSVRETDMLSISMYSNDADEAALLINTLIEVYSLIDLEWARGELSHLEKFLSNQIEKKEIQLRDAEEGLQNFQQEEQIFGMNENAQLLLNNLIRVESQYYQAKAEINIINERKIYILNQLTQEEKKLTETVSSSINSRLFALKNEIAMKETEFISAMAQQGEGHQVVRVLREKIELLKTKLQKETNELISQGISVADPIKFRQALMDSVISFNAFSAMQEAKAYEFKKMVNKYQSQLSSLPKKVLEFTRISRNLKIYSDTYSLMRQKLEEVRISEASIIGKVRIVDEARPVYSRISPKRKQNMMLALILGIGLGVGIAFLRELMDQTIKTVTELERRNLSILALIPAIGRQGTSNSKTKRYQNKLGSVEKIQRRLITHEDPKSPVSEAYRGLRTSLLYSKLTQKDEGNVILISSPGPGEGKTTTIVNLAITYANLGLKTILLDTDLRKPVAHKVFSVNRDPGITKLLSGFEEDYSRLIQTTEIDKLDIITCGVIPPNPSEILESVHMSNLIKKLRQDYDVILMDAPPLLAVTDAFVCMKYTDQFILVVRSGVTEKAGLDRALSQIQHTDTKLSGVVVNAIDESNSYSGYYYNYYQYYYGDEK